MVIFSGSVYSWTMSQFPIENLSVLQQVLRLVSYMIFKVRSLYLTTFKLFVLEEFVALEFCLPFFPIAINISVGNKMCCVSEFQISLK